MKKQNETSPGGVPSGLVIINKHAGVTSHDIVNRIRSLYQTRQVGHTGTLDPMATGVLPILVGRAAKAAEFLTTDSKHYTAKMKLGIVTDTEDTSGNIISKISSGSELPTRDEVKNCAASFVGEIEQIPPMYSAIKVGGHKLVDLARQGITVERKSRPVTIYSLNIKPLSKSECRTNYTLDIHCSKGTYIRTLCADIGRALGCGAAMSSLIRTKSGNFGIDQAVSIDRLSEMNERERLERLLPVDQIFTDLPAICLSPFYARLAHCGAEIYQHKINTAFDIDQKIRLYNENGFFALGAVKEFKEGSAIKPIKLFVL